MVRVKVAAAVPLFLLVLAGMPPAAAVITTSATAADVAASIESEAGLVTGATWTEYPTGTATRGDATACVGVVPPGAHPATPTAVSTTPIAPFATHGASFGILTNGDAALANAPDDSDCERTTNGNNARGAFDVVVLAMDVVVPAPHNCLSFDFRFLSEEFPEFQNAGVNDAFVAELDSSTWTVAGGTIMAPDNFAFDTSGDPVNVDQASMSSGNAAGTTYDGATQLLSATTPAPAGPHTVFLSIFDVGDAIYDSAVFVDNMRSYEATQATGGCQPGARPPPPPPDPVLPIPDFSAYYTGCPGTTLVFTDRTNPGTFTLTDWVWSFGNATAKGRTAQHTFGQSGTYWVNLTVSFPQNRQLSIVKSVSVPVCTTYPAPPVNEPPLMGTPGRVTVEAGQLMRFTVSGQDREDDILVYSVAGLPPGAGFEPLNRTFWWRPTMDQVGEHCVRFIATEYLLDWPKPYWTSVDASYSSHPNVTVQSNAGLGCITVFVRDADTDMDGVQDVADNCPTMQNHDQRDSDHDGHGDACQPPAPRQRAAGPGGPGALMRPDRDGDGSGDGVDNCPEQFNRGQADQDQDRVGDVCDADADGDGAAERAESGDRSALLDNCPALGNPDQADHDQDGVGDACDQDDATQPAAGQGPGQEPLATVAAPEGAASAKRTLASFALPGIALVVALALAAAALVAMRRRDLL